MVNIYVLSNLWTCNGAKVCAMPETCYYKYYHFPIWGLFLFGRSVTFKVTFNFSCCIEAKTG